MDKIFVTWLLLIQLWYIIAGLRGDRELTNDNHVLVFISDEPFTED